MADDGIAVLSGIGLFLVLYTAPSLDSMSQSRLLVAAGLAVLCLGALAVTAFARRRGGGGRG